MVKGGSWDVTGDSVSDAGFKDVIAGIKVALPCVSSMHPQDK